MKTHSLIAFALSFSLFAAAAKTAHAQEPLAPSPMPAWQLAPPMQDVLDLERRGRQKKLAGALLMGIGSAVIVAGIAAVGYAVVHSFDADCFNQPVCGSRNVGLAGSALAMIGSAAFVAGIPVYIVGRAQVKRAHIMSARLALAPTVGRSGPDGGMLMAQLQF